MTGHWRATHYYVSLVGSQNTMLEVKTALRLRLVLRADESWRGVSWGGCLVCHKSSIPAQPVLWLHFSMQSEELSLRSPAGSQQLLKVSPFVREPRVWSWAVLVVSGLGVPWVAGLVLSACWKEQAWKITHCLGIDILFQLIYYKTWAELGWYEVMLMDSI